MWWRELEMAAPADVAWTQLVDTRRWPDWGPTVTAVRLDHAGHELGAVSTGAVRTPLGLWLPFAVEDWYDTPHRTWSWRVAGLGATTHVVEETAADRCLVRFGVPGWAPAYLPVVEVGLRRIRALVQNR